MLHIVQLTIICVSYIALGQQGQSHTPTLGLVMHLLKECATNCQSIMEDNVNSVSETEQVKIIEYTYHLVVYCAMCSLPYTVFKDIVVMLMLLLYRLKNLVLKS